VSRSRLATAALHAYPPAARESLGEEMLATVLDVGADSRRRFARELLDLVRGGLRARGLQTSRAGARRIVADGVCLAGAWLMTLDLAVAVAQRWRGMHDSLLTTPSIALLAVVLALALVGFDRVAGAGAVLWLGLRFPALVADEVSPMSLVGQVVPLACFATMISAPRREPPQPRRLVYLLVPAGLIAVAGPPVAGLPVLIALTAALGVTAYAALMLPADPRLAIAGAIPATALGLDRLPHSPNLFPLLLIATAPAVLAIAVTRTRALRRATL
jgi:hypothetical protein